MSRVESNLKLFDAAVIVAGTVVYWRGRRIGLVVAAGGLASWVLSSQHSHRQRQERVVTALKTRVHQLKEERASSMLELESKAAEIVELQGRIDEHVAALEQERASSMRELESKAAEIEELQAGIEKHVAALKEERTSSERQLESKETEIAELQAVIRETSGELEEWKEKATSRSDDGSARSEPSLDNRVACGIHGKWQSIEEHDQEVGRLSLGGLNDHLKDCCKTSEGKARLVEDKIVGPREWKSVYRAIFKKMEIDLPPSKFLNLVRKYQHSPTLSGDAVSAILDYAKRRQGLTEAQVIDLTEEVRRWWSMESPPNWNAISSIILASCESNLDALVCEFDRRLGSSEQRACDSALRIICEITEVRSTHPPWLEFLRELIGKRPLLPVRLPHLDYLVKEGITSLKNLQQGYAAASRGLRFDIHSRLYDRSAANEPISISELLRIVKPDEHLVGEMVADFAERCLLDSVFSGRKPPFGYSDWEELRERFVKEMQWLREKKPKLYERVYSSQIARCTTYLESKSLERVEKSAGDYFHLVLTLAPTKFPWPDKKTLLDAKGNWGKLCCDVELCLMHMSPKEKWTKQEREAIEKFLSRTATAILKPKGSRKKRAGIKRAKSVRGKRTPSRRFSQLLRRGSPSKHSKASSENDSKDDNS